MQDINGICDIIVVVAQLGVLIFAALQMLDFPSDILDWGAKIIGAATGAFLSALVALLAIHYKDYVDKKTRQRKLFAGLRIELAINYQASHFNRITIEKPSFPGMNLTGKCVNELLEEMIKPKGWDEGDIKKMKLIAKLIHDINAAVNFRNSSPEKHSSLIKDHSDKLIKQIAELNKSDLKCLGKFLDDWPQHTEPEYLEEYLPP